MKEIVVISGKGGTGKTTVTAALAGQVAPDAVICDCDVDASDMHILMDPTNTKDTPFISGFSAKIDKEKCIECGKCRDVCHFSAVEETFIINSRCEGCGTCTLVCDAEAINLKLKKCGRSFVSDTRFGKMSHAELDIGEENSGRLVTVVRETARKYAEDLDLKYIISDGPPGIGCPVISSMTGVDYAVIVVEPTISGFHDLKRVHQLIKHFKIRAGVIINKSDINNDIAQEIRKYCIANDADHLGDLAYDKAFVDSQIEGKVITEYSSKYKKIINDIWNKILKGGGL